MGKVSFVVVLLAAALLAAHAYALRTTITTVEVDEGNQGRGERCREMREQVGSCEQFLRQVLEHTRRRDNHNQWPWGEREKESFQECCGELRNVDGKCQCDALGEVTRELQSHEEDEHRREYLDDLASQLPLECGLTPPLCWF